MTDILDIEGIFRFPWDKVFLISGLVLGIFLLSYLLYRFIGWLKKRRAQKRLSLKPHERAFQALKQLEGQKLIEAGKFKTYYFALDEIFRNYLTGRYRMNALEKTPAEILSDMRQKLVLSEPFMQDAKDFFQDAELVKFAELIPTPGEARRNSQKITSWIQKTEDAAPS